MNKKAQIQLAFNWIYILIAGTVILLFFIGLVVKQKAASERQLSGDVLRIMESIFTGANVAEKTKNSIDISSLQDYTLYFSCEDGVGEYGLQGQSQQVQDNVIPIFAPLEIKGTQLNLWSLPYKLPFKVIDFLLVTSENTKYFLLGNNPFIDEFINETKLNVGVRFRINAVRAENPSEIDSGNYFQVRIVDFSGLSLDNKPVPPGVSHLDDHKVTAVSFSTGNSVIYYQKQGGLWKRLHVNPIPLISLGGQRDAVKYAAIFAGNDQVYLCNMHKAFQRLKILNEVYGGQDIQNGEAGGKLKEMMDYYDDGIVPFSQRSDCLGYLRDYDQQNLLFSLTTHQNTVAACLLQQELCRDLISSAQKIKILNNNLGLNCLTLY